MTGTSPVTRGPGRSEATRGPWRPCRQNSAASCPNWQQWAGVVVAANVH